MAKIIGQRWEVYQYNRVKNEVLKKGEKIVINETPDFGDAVIQLISPDGIKTVETIYNEWKNGEGSPFRTAEEQARIDAETLESAKDYADEVAKNEWLKPVNTVSQLVTTGLSNKKNYLCKVIADPGKSGVYQVVAGWTNTPVWTLFDNSVDLVNEQELATVVNNHNTDTQAHNISLTATTNTDTTTSTGAVSGALASLLQTIWNKIRSVVNYLTAHTGNTNNPHSVTKAQVGLGNIDNTSDEGKPISNATQTALDLKQNKLNRVVESNDNSTEAITDNGGDLSIPISVTVAAGDDTATLPVITKVSLRAWLTSIRNNVSCLFNKIGKPNGIATLDPNGLVPQSQIPSTPVAINRTLTANDNATGTVKDEGGDLSIPIPVTTAAPAASETQTTEGTRSLRAQLKILIDNVASIFTKFSSPQYSSLKTETIPAAKGIKSMSLMWGNGMTDAPNTDWGWVLQLHLFGNASYLHQYYFTLHTGEIYQRRKLNDNWGEWHLIFTPTLYPYQIITLTEPNKEAEISAMYGGIWTRSSTTRTLSASCAAGSVSIGSSSSKVSGTVKLGLSARQGSTVSIIVAHTNGSGDTTVKLMSNTRGLLGTYSIASNTCSINLPSVVLQEGEEVYLEISGASAWIYASWTASSFTRTEYIYFR